MRAARPAGVFFLILCLAACLAQPRLSGQLSGLGTGYWYEGQTGGSGTFLVLDGKTYEVDADLADVNGPFDSGWDGRSLTKDGGGMLDLSVIAGYTGTTLVASGTLYVEPPYGISASSHVIVNGVLLFSHNIQQIANLSGEDTGVILFSNDNSTLAVENNEDTIYWGSILANGITGIQLTKTGTSTLTLAGNSSFGSTLVDSGTLVITGTITNDLVTGSGARIAPDDGNDAAVSVSGNGQWNIAANFYVGYSGTGLLNVTENGKVEITENICIGGTHSTGVGFMNIDGNGVVTSATSVLGYEASGTGVAQLAGSALWETRDAILIGQGGYGALTLADSSTVTSAGGFLGFYANASGTVLLSGNSLWKNTDGLSIGHGGGAQGSLLAEGNARMEVTLEIDVGNEGTGTMELRDNAFVSTEDTLEIGYAAGSFGTVIITDSGSMTATSEIDVGYEGSGTMELRDNALVSTSAFIAIGSEAGSSGAVALAGNAIMEATGAIYVGDDGTGSLELRDNALVRADYVVIGAGAGSDGTLELVGGVLETGSIEGSDGAGQLLFDSGTLRATRDTTGLISGLDAPQIGDGGGTIDTAAFDATIDSGFTGDGGLRKIGSGTLTLTGSSAHAGNTEIGQGALVITHTAALGETGTTTILQGAELHVNTAEIVFANTLAGPGLLAVGLDAPDSTFVFSQDTPGVFTGIASFGQSTFELTQAASAVLAGATLQLGAGNTTIVSGDGARTVGNLTLDGGLMVFDVTIPADTAPQAIVQVTDALVIASGGTIAINLPTPGSPPPVSEQLPLLQQDDNPLVQLIASRSVTGPPSNMVLVDSAGNLITDAQAIDINQNGVTVATGTYDYMVETTSAAGIGLFVGYGLKHVDILDGETLVLDNDKAVPYVASEFHAIISGNGNLVIAADNAISLNAENTYTGTTFVERGLLIAGADNALGDTAFLHVSPGATFNLNNYEQTIREGGVIDGQLTGAGTLNLVDSLFAVHTANAGLAALINATGTVQLDHVQGLGDSSTIALNSDAAMLILAPAEDGTFATAITGDTGSFIKDSEATVTIPGANDFSGHAFVNAGTLSATNIDALGSADVEISDGAAFEYRAIASGTSMTTFTGAGTLVVASSTLALGADNEMDYAHITDAVVYMLADNALGGSAAMVTLANENSAIHIDTDAAQLGTLHMNGGLLAFTPQSDPAAAYHRASIASLGSSAGSFLFNIDFTGANGLMTPGAGMKANSLDIADDSASDEPHLVQVNHTGSPSASTSSFELITTGNGLAEFVLDTNNGKIDFDLISYELNRGDGTDLMPDPNNWYLAGNGPANVVDIIGIAATIPLDWNNALDALYLRMGDILSDATNPDATGIRGNAWVRGRAYRMNATNSATARDFKQYGWGMTAGADKAFATQTSMNLLGGFIDVGAVDRDFDLRGDSKTRDVALGLYLTHIRPGGWFADVVARVDRYSNILNARTPENRAINGRYNNRSIGLSAEAGRRLQHPGGWWVEPALQVRMLWVTGGEFDMTSGDLRIHVKQDDFSSMQYRALVRCGRQIGASKWHPYGKFGVAAIDSGDGALHANGTSISSSYDGGRVEFGLGANYRISPACDLYLDYEYARAPKYERPWTFNLGCRYLW